MILRMVVGDQRVYVPKRHHKRMRGQLGFELFALNRQLWAEAFPLFWGTSRICFNEGYKLEECLDRLTECQKTNLKHLGSIVHLTYYHSSRPDDYDMVYRRTKHEWRSCDLKNAGTHPLRFLESLQLRLTLHDWDDPPASLLGTIHAGFRALANLRFAHLKEAEVTIRTKGTDPGESLTAEKLAEIAASFESTLLNPIVTKEDHTRFLTDQLYALRKSLKTEEAQYSRIMTEVNNLQKQADGSREEADKMKERISNVQDALQTQDEVVPHRVLRCRLGTTGNHEL